MNDFCLNDCCGGCGGNPCDKGCNPAKYGCNFQILASPYDPSIWNVTICGATTKVKIPKINETDTKLSVSYSNKVLTYNAEKHTDIITGEQIGSIIDLDDLRDVDAATAESCDLLVFNPFCSDCGDGCRPKDAQWTHYHIPDAGDCVLETDAEGYYKVLTKNDCGCIEECRIPVVPSGMTSINYVRDSVPDDPDFPWYYGQYNDTIGLHLKENAPQYFGKYALKVTVNYGVQAILSKFCPNYNFRSIVVPVVEGETPRITNEASTLQSFAAWTVADDRSFPWGTTSLRGSFVFIVPKGKEASLYHEYRLRTGASTPNYYSCPKDGQKVPDSEIGLDTIPYPASRLNALQVIVEPTFGEANFSPVIDDERDQLDAPVDLYPNPYS